MVPASSGPLPGPDPHPLQAIRFWLAWRAPALALHSALTPHHRLRQLQPHLDYRQLVLALLAGLPQATAQTAAALGECRLSAWCLRQGRLQVQWAGCWDLPYCWWAPLLALRDCCCVQQLQLSHSA